MRLRAAGWNVQRIWEHEEPVLAAKKVARRLAILGASTRSNATPVPDPKTDSAFRN
jgi:hypothetical protein